MMKNVLDLVLGLVLMMYCLPTVESKECDTIETDVGVHGMQLDIHFSMSNLRDKYKTYLNERYGKKIKQDEIQNQDLIKESVIRFKKERDSRIEDIIYRNGNPTEWVGKGTEIFMTNDTFVVKKKKLQKEDAGIYWIEFRDIRLGRKTLVVTDKPKITQRSPPNPVLKPENKYISTIQLECHSVSTSIGDCPLSMNTLWYRNGMRMTEVDPTLSQINVTVDHNGGNFTCLVTDYLPCYQRLQTTNLDNVLNIEECNYVFEGETFKLQPEYKPYDVKLEPDQGEIIVHENEDLKVSCSANCHPKCDVRWEKDYKGIQSSSFITKNMIGRDLKIENIQKSHEGVYVCLVKNVHGEVKKKFTLSVGGTWDNEQNIVMFYLLVSNIIIVVFMAMVFIIVSVIFVFWFKKRKKEKKMVLESIEDGELEEKKMVLESIEDGELEEKKMVLESIEDGELEEKKMVLESIEDGELEEKKMVLENFKKNEFEKMEKKKKKVLENFMKKEFEKIEERKKKMFECVEKGEPKITEEEKKKMLENFKKKEFEKMEKRKQKMIKNLEWNTILTIEEGKKMSESIEEREPLMMGGMKKMLDSIAEREDGRRGEERLESSEMTKLI